MKNDRQNTKMLKGIKAKLLKILLPCIAIAIISIIVISYMASKKIIVQEAKNLLRAESKMNAKELETWTTGILNTLDMLQNTLETVPMDEETEKTYLATTVNMNQDFPNGVYIGDDHGKYIDMSGWVPDADYGITERDWYKEGLTHKSFAFGTPYRDADTGEFIVSATTLLKTSNGAKTVAAADVFLNYASKMVSDIKVMDDGYAFLVDKNSHTILAHKDQKLVAQTISSCNLLEYLTQRDIQTKNSGVNVRYRGKHRFFKGFNEFIKEKTRRCDNDFEKIERHVFFLMELSTILWIIKRTTAWKHWFLAICERLSFSKYLIDWL